MALVLASIVTAVIAAALISLPGSHAEVGGSRNHLLALRCEDGASVTATFMLPIRANLSRAFGEPDQIWIDLSLSDNGFLPGTFVGFGPQITAELDRTIVEWGGLLPGRRHYYRLNAFINGQWRQMAPTAAFDTPNCADITGIECDESSATNTVYFSSAPRPGNPPVAKWVDISLFDNNFAAGTFLGSRIEGNSVIWQGIKPAAVHYYRMNWHYPDTVGWAVQARGSILTLDCHELPRR